MSFREFLETSLEHVPPEFERNFTLLRQLEEQSNDLIPKVNKVVKDYKKARTISERKQIKKEIDELMGKMTSFADDKIALAVQTYECVDRNIKLLTNIGNPNLNTLDASKEPQPLIGYDMPIDSNEPRFCFCRGVSHGDMVGCDNKNCLIEWFHYACVGLTEAPKGSWYCKDCIPTTKKQKKRKSRKFY